MVRRSRFTERQILAWVSHGSVWRLGSGVPYRVVWRILGWVALLAIVVLSLVPGSERPHTGAPTFTEHIAAYIVAGTFLSIGYCSTSRRNISLWFLLLLLAGILETLQMLVPGRNPRVVDFLASGAGAAAGVLVGWLLIRGLSARSI